MLFNALLIYINYIKVDIVTIFLFSKLPIVGWCGEVCNYTTTKLGVNVDILTIYP